MSGTNRFVHSAWKTVKSYSISLTLKVLEAGISFSDWLSFLVLFTSLLKTLARLYRNINKEVIKNQSEKLQSYDILAQVLSGT